MAAASRSKLLAHCRSLPDVTEDVKWGDHLCFCIGGKMFTVLTVDSKEATFRCKVAEEDFGALTGIDGIEPAAYVARYHWIAVKDPKVLPAAEALALVTGSYELVKAKLPKKRTAAKKKTAKKKG